MGGPPPKSPGTELLKSSQGAWAETRPLDDPVKKDGAEEGGPIPIAVAYGKADSDPESPQQMPGMPPEPGADTPRIVVFGSADAFSDRYADDSRLGNFSVITKSIAWASGRANLVTIAAKHMTTHSFSLNRSDRNVIRLVHVLVLLGIVGSGVYIWWRRR
jgi:hypothetical protein